MSDDIPTAEDVKGILSDVGGYSPRRLEAAAHSAAHRLPDEYDSVRAVEALPQSLRVLAAVEEHLAEMEGNLSMTDNEKALLALTRDALAKARGDDAE